MQLRSLIRKVSGSRLLGKATAATSVPSVLEQPARFPYGPFRFAIRLTAGVSFEILASTDLKNWSAISKSAASAENVEFLDSDAPKFSHRFYRVLADAVPSANVIGYATLTLPPGFSMISNPFDGSNNTVEELFKGWPEATALNRFDSRLFRLTQNAVKDGRWMDPLKPLLPGQGALFFNPTSDYRPVNFAGEVAQGSLSIPIPSGFSVCSSLIPQAGDLVSDLEFPIAEGDVIHLFDRDRQQYVLHPYEGGKWTSGPPIVGVGESFWVAKTSPANWTRNFAVA